ncbi:cyclic nucleotide-binding domain-containing protein, partial [Candidatus Woesearchaeota archaeon]|nr:cyclic nucleotide-binding domain-containing protein [Candidatus Woesearchaeota archaeon]
MEENKDKKYSDKDLIARFIEDIKPLIVKKLEASKAFETGKVIFVDSCCMTFSPFLEAMTQYYAETDAEIKEKLKGKELKTFSFFWSGSFAESTGVTAPGSLTKGYNIEDELVYTLVEEHNPYDPSFASNPTYINLYKARTLMNTYATDLAIDTIFKRYLKKMEVQAEIKNKIDNLILEIDSAMAERDLDKLNTLFSEIGALRGEAKTKLVTGAAWAPLIGTIYGKQRDIINYLEQLAPETEEERILKTIVAADIMFKDSAFKFASETLRMGEIVEKTLVGLRTEYVLTKELQDKLDNLLAKVRERNNKIRIDLGLEKAEEKVEIKAPPKTFEELRTAEHGEDITTKIFGTFDNDIIPAPTDADIAAALEVGKKEFETMSDETRRMVLNFYLLQLYEPGSYLYNADTSLTLENFNREIAPFFPDLKYEDYDQFSIWQYGELKKRLKAKKAQAEALRIRPAAARSLEEIVQLPAKRELLSSELEARLNELRSSLGIAHPEYRPQLSALFETIGKILAVQSRKSDQISFLAPDAQHISRVIDNVEEFMQWPELGKKLEAVYGKKAQSVAVLAAILSKIGFAHNQLDVDDRQSYKSNRIFAEEIMASLGPTIKQTMNLNDAQYKSFEQAILEEGTFGTKTEYYAGKYSNPLTALLTLSSEMDVSQKRLLDWQKDIKTINILNRIYTNQKVLELYNKRSALEIELLNAIKSKDDGKIKSAETKIAESRDEFNTELAKVVEQELQRAENEIREKIKTDATFRVREAELEKYLAQAREYLDQINAESFEWYVSSFVLDNVRVSGKEGEPLTISFESLLSYETKDKFEAMGAASRLDYLYKFHADRMRDIATDISNDLGVKINVEHKKLVDKPEIKELIDKSPKADTHTHLKMSLAFRILMNDVFLNPDIDVSDPKISGNVMQTQNLLSKFFETEIDLVNVINLARGSAQGLHEELLEMYDAYGIFPEYTEMPKNKQLLVQDAEELINDLGEGMDPADRKLLEKRIGLFNKMQQQLRWLFSFDEGTLVEFVQVFIATSGMYKILPEEKMALLRSITKEYIIEYAEDNAAYVEPRTNVGNEEESTEDLANIIAAYKSVKGKKPDMRIILSFGKGIIQNAKDQQEMNSEEARIKANAENAKTVVSILKKAIENPDKVYLEIEGETVTGRDILHYFAGVDTAGQEEYNPPKLFIEAFNIIDDYNKFVNELPEETIAKLGIARGQLVIGKTTHVSEGISDVSIESAIRHGFEGLYNDQLTEDHVPTKPSMQRLGHLIAPAVNLDQFLGQTRTERISERIDQIKFDLALLKMGIPLISVTEAGLRAELADLEKKDPTDSVEITYTPEMITDLKIRAGFLLDHVVKSGTVVETNPTSNVGIGPINSFKDHTLNVYKDYTYGKWIEWVKADLADNNIALAKLQAYEDNIDTEMTSPVNPAEKPELVKGKLIKATINTDDLTLFETTLSREIYKVAEALDIPVDRLMQMVREGFDSRIGWRTLERAEEVAQSFQEIEEKGLITAEDEKKFESADLKEFLDSLSADEKSEFLSRFKDVLKNNVLTINAGERFITEGETDRVAYLILDGEYSVVYRHLPVEWGAEMAAEEHEKIKESVTLKLGPGSLVGERGLVRGQRRSADVIAQKRLRALKISIDDLNKIFEGRPDLQGKFIAAMGTLMEKRDQHRKNVEFQAKANAVGLIGVEQKAALIKLIGDGMLQFDIEAGLTLEEILEQEFQAELKKTGIKKSIIPLLKNLMESGRVKARIGSGIDNAEDAMQRLKKRLNLVPGKEASFKEVLNLDNIVMTKSNELDDLIDKIEDVSGARPIVFDEDIMAAAEIMNENERKVRLRSILDGKLERKLQAYSNSGFLRDRRDASDRTKYDEVEMVKASLTRMVEYFLQTDDYANKLEDFLELLDYTLDVYVSQKGGTIMINGVPVAYGSGGNRLRGANDAIHSIMDTDKFDKLTDKYNEKLVLALEQGKISQEEFNNRFITPDMRLQIRVSLALHDAMAGNVRNANAGLGIFGEVDDLKLGHGEAATKYLATKRTLMTRLFGETGFERMARTIAIHDNTDLNFADRESTIDTLVAIGDNTAAEEKFSYAFTKIPGNEALVGKLYELEKLTGEAFSAFVTAIKYQMTENIKNARKNGLITELEERTFLHTVDNDLNVQTAKFNLGAYNIGASLARDVDFEFDIENEKVKGMTATYVQERSLLDKRFRDLYPEYASKHIKKITAEPYGTKGVDYDYEKDTEVSKEETKNGFKSRIVIQIRDRTKPAAPTVQDQSISDFVEGIENAHIDATNKLAAARDTKAKLRVIEEYFGLSDFELDSAIKERKITEEEFIAEFEKLVKKQTALELRLEKETPLAEKAGLKLYDAQSWIKTEQDIDEIVDLMVEISNSAFSVYGVQQIDVDMAKSFYKKMLQRKRPVLFVTKDGKIAAHITTMTTISATAMYIDELAVKKQYQ